VGCFLRAIILWGCVEKVGGELEVRRGIAVDAGETVMYMRVRRSNI